MALYRIDEHEPRVPASAWVAESAEVIGRATLGEDSSVWYGAVIRADNDTITIGDRSNVQDGAVLHADPGYPIVMGNEVTVGHQAMVHGCTIGDGCLIGIRSVVMNGAVLGENCVVGAGAIVTEGKQFPPGSLVLGAPAKLARALTPEQQAQFRSAAQRYVRNARWHRAGTQRVR